MTIFVKIWLITLVIFITYTIIVKYLYLPAHKKSIVKAYLGNARDIPTGLAVMVLSWFAFACVIALYSIFLALYTIITM